MVSVPRKPQDRLKKGEKKDDSPKYSRRQVVEDTSKVSNRVNDAHRRKKRSKKKDH